MKSLSNPLEAEALSLIYPCPTCGTEHRFPDVVLVDEAFFLRGKRVPLTKSEVRLFVFLFRNLGKPVNRERCYAEVYKDKGADYGEAEITIIHVWVSRLRKELRDAGAPFEVKTVQDIGYILRRKT